MPGTKYEIYGYDKDGDVEVFLTSHPDAADAMADASLVWMPLARDEAVRNLHGRLSSDAGEPFDWLVVRAPDGSDTIIPFTP